MREQVAPLLHRGGHLLAVVEDGPQAAHNATDLGKEFVLISVMGVESGIDYEAVAIHVDCVEPKSGSRSCMNVNRDALARLSEGHSGSNADLRNWLGLKETYRQRLTRDQWERVIIKIVLPCCVLLATDAPVPSDEQPRTYCLALRPPKHRAADYSRCRRQKTPADADAATMNRDGQSAVTPTGKKSESVPHPINLMRIGDDAIEDWIETAYDLVRAEAVRNDADESPKATDARAARSASHTRARLRRLEDEVEAMLQEARL